MAKTIISQARGHGSFTYRVRRKAFKYKVAYPVNLNGEGIIIKLLNSPAHTAPLAKILLNNKTFYIPAYKGMIEGQKINFNDDKIENGKILPLDKIPVKSPIYCIEMRPNDGGKLIKAGGTSAEIRAKIGEEVVIAFPSKKEKRLSKYCRAIIGIIAGQGRLDKPLVKAGKQHYIKKAKNKLWPRTSAIKMNAIDHPFGSGRGKVPKSKIAKRNAPAGRRVGLIRPKRTGKRK